MNRGLVFCVLALMLLGASVASAGEGWYGGLRLAGYATSVDIEDGVCRDYYIETDADGLFDYTEMTFGKSFEKFDGEISFGMARFSAKYEGDSEGERQYDYDNSLMMYTFGLTGLYHVSPPSSFSLDAGLRFQLHSMSFETESEGGYRQTYTYTDKYSGWSVGPVVRGRWWFAGDSMALGPEIYLRYTSMTHEMTWDYDSRADVEEEIDLSEFVTEYSVRLDFYF